MKQGVVVLLLVAFALCGARADPQFERTTLRVGDAVFAVELAMTPAQRQQGLMFREILPLFSGMLFLFPEDQVLGFWMKNTMIPLSIAFIDAGGTIVSIQAMEPFSLEPVSSGVPVRYALEVNRGVFDRLGIRPGDRVDLEPVLRRVGGRIE